MKITANHSHREITKCSWKKTENYTTIKYPRHIIKRKPLSKRPSHKTERNNYLNGRTNLNIETQEF
jgi:hypothetical protein